MPSDAVEVASVPDEERRDAEKTGVLALEKPPEIMDLQADIDTLLRDGHPTPLDSKRWRYASAGAQRRLAVMTALRFVLFEPADWVEGNDESGAAADRMLTVIGSRLKTLATRMSDR